MSQAGARGQPVSGAEPEVLFARLGHVGLITLNRPRALNALTLGMLRAMHRQLDAWADDGDVASVVIQGTGERAFCAGGDIRSMHRDRLDDGPLRRELYRVEYALNRAIFRYPKPYVALLDGVTMGGGVGVSVHGSHRVVTERTLFAMPEAGIGFFPDVGGGYFLPRCPGEIGMYLGLTGARLAAPDCLYAGVGTHFVPAAAVPALIEALGDVGPNGAGPDGVASVIEAHGETAAAAPLAAAPLATHRAAIDRCFSADSVRDILGRLEAEDTDWARQTAAALRGNAPTSLKVTFRQLRQGRDLDFDAVMVMEYRLSQHFMAGDDFFEGVRAVLIDKDQAPAWRPARLDGVSDATVEDYFAPLAEDLTFD